MCALHVEETSQPGLAMLDTCGLSAPSRQTKTEVSGSHCLQWTNNSITNGDRDVGQKLMLLVGSRWGRGGGGMLA